MRGLCRSFFLAQCVLATGALVSPASAEQSTFLDDFQQLSALLQAGETAQGLSFARELEDSYAGIPEFDYLFGLAAIAEGDYNSASFSFERILILQPDHHRARLEFARSQYFLGNFTNAKYHFDEVLANNPPETVRKNVRKFLEAIENARSVAEPHRFRLLLALSGGYDSNINSATDQQTIDLFGLRFALAESGQETDDSFARLGADADYRYQLSQTQALFSSLSLEQKNNIETDEFDLSNVAWKAGYNHRFGSHWLSASLKYQHYWLETSELLYSGGVEGQWQVEAGKWTPYAFMSASVIRYPDDSQQNRNQYLGGIGAQFQPGDLTLNVSGFGGHEPSTDSNFEALGRDHGGVNVSLTTNWQSPHELGLELSYLLTRYRDRAPVFNKTRQDERRLAKLSWQISLAPKLSVFSSVSYRENESNLSLYDYDQWLVETGISYRAF